jgi:glycolate oxidase iron-sulfur subunit
MHLVDHARNHIEQHHTRPLPERLMRNILGYVMPRPAVFRLAMYGAMLARPFRGPLKALGSRRLASALNLVSWPAKTRMGYEVVVSEGESCCGSLTHHMGRAHQAHGFAKRLIDQWTTAKLDHIIITASGCGTTIKDYGFMLKHDPDYAEKAKALSAKAMDVTEFLSTLNLSTRPAKSQRVAYHSACSMQHGQKITQTPISLLQTAGFEVVTVPEGHLCCGSAGTYNMMQPEIADQLRARKLSNIISTFPDIVATGNLGCITQLQSGLGKPILHTVELLDWAYGGPRPKALNT